MMAWFDKVGPCQLDNIGKVVLLGFSLINFKSSWSERTWKKYRFKYNRIPVLNILFMIL